MRDFDDYEGEMARLSKLSDRDLDRILQGEAPGDPEGPAEDLADFVWSIRGVGEGRPEESIERRHLAAIVERSRRLAGDGEPAARPARRAREVGPRSVVLPTLRRKLMPAGLFATLTAKIAGVAVAATVATGGLAAAGALPDPAQGVVAGVLSTVGIEVPDGDGGEGDFSPAPLEEGSTASEHASDTAKSVLTVVDGWIAGMFDSGCEFGRAVATAAGADPSGAAPCPTPGEKGESGRAKGEEASAAGKAKADEKSAAGRAKGEEASAAGKAKADEKSAAGKAKGEEASGGAGGGPPTTGAGPVQPGSGSNPAGKP